MNERTENEIWLDKYERALELTPRLGAREFAKRSGLKDEDIIGLLELREELAGFYGDVEVFDAMERRQTAAAMRLSSTRAEGALSRMNAAGGKTRLARTNRRRSNTPAWNPVWVSLAAACMLLSLSAVVFLVNGDPQQSATDPIENQGGVAQSAIRQYNPVPGAGEAMADLHARFVSLGLQSSAEQKDEEILELLPRADSLLREHPELAKTPEYRTLLQDVGLATMNQAGDAAGALGFFEQVLKLTEPRPAQTDFYYAGLAAFRAGDIDKAESYLAQTVRGNSATSYADHARTLMAQFPPLRTGSLVLPFTSQTVYGDSFNLSDYSGKPVLLLSWIPGCPWSAQVAQWLKNEYNTFHNRGLQVVMIPLLADVKYVKKNCDCLQLPWPTLADGPAVIKQIRMFDKAAMQTAYIPRMVYCDGEGRVEFIVDVSTQDDFQEAISKITSGR